MIKMGLIFLSTHFSASKTELLAKILNLEAVLCSFSSNNTCCKYCF